MPSRPGIEWSADEFDRCPHCGSLSPVPYATLGGKRRRFVPYPCDCAGARAALARAEEAARREARPQVRSRFRSSIGGYSVGDYAECVRGGMGLWVTGPFGTGKTTFANALAEELRAGGMRTEVTQLLKVLGEIMADWSAKDRIMGRLARVPALVLDDLGKENPTENTVTTLFEVVNDRYEAERPLVVTSNMTIGGLGAWVARADAGKAEAITSRLAEMVQTVEMTGRDRRLSR